MNTISTPAHCYSLTAPQTQCLLLLLFPSSHAVALLDADAHCFIVCCHPCRPKERLQSHACWIDPRHSFKLLLRRTSCESLLAADGALMLTVQLIRQRPMLQGHQLLSRNSRLHDSDVLYQNAVQIQEAARQLLKSSSLSACALLLSEGEC